MSVRSPLGGTPLGATTRSAGFGLSQGAFDARAGTSDSRSSSRRGLVAVGTLLLGGFAVAVAAANTESLLPESIRPVPGPLAGAFAAAGLNLHWVGSILALSLMFVSYAIVVAASRELSGRTVLMGIALLHGIVLLAPPLISTDIFSYQAYARMGALYGTNPYVHGPHAIALDPLFPYIGAKWSYIPSVYGPAFTTFSYLLAPLSIAASVVAYKALAVLASLAIVALVWNGARLRGVDQVRAVALVGLNPLLVLYGVGGGHNDLLMLLAMVGAIYAILAYRDRLGGGLAVLAIGIKLTAGVMLPFAIAAGGPRRGRGRRDLMLGAGAVLGLIGSLSFILFGSRIVDVFATVQRSQGEGDWHSIPGMIGITLGQPAAGRIVAYGLAGAFVGVSAWLLRRVWRGQTDWINGAGWATVAMLLAASSLLPWYVAWALPLAALGTDRRLVRATVVLTGVVLACQMLGYIPRGGPLLG